MIRAADRPLDAGATRYRFAVLGPVRAWRDDVEIDPGSPQQCAVLGMLLARRGRFISLDEIVDGLWGDRLPVTAGATARTYISRLRRAFRDSSGVLIRGLSGGYSIEADTVTADFIGFEELLEAARSSRARGEVAMAAGQLERARDLWSGGTALAGVPGDAAEHERARLEQLRLAASQQLLELKLELGRHVEVAAEVPVVIAAHEMDEQLRETYMLALYRCGRQAEALDEYRKIQSLLGRELGVDPGPRLRSLHERLLRADPSLHPTAPSRLSARPVEGSGRAQRAGGESDGGQLIGSGPGGSEPGGREPDGSGPGGSGPVPLGVRLRERRHRLFVGRERERQIFAAALGEATEDRVVLYLTGLGGIGKTALLQSLADDARAAGRAVLRVDAGALGASRGAFLAVAEQLSAVSDAVLMIDAFETRHELDSWFQAQFLPRLPSRTVVVIASRERPSPAWRAEGASAGSPRVVALDEFTTREALAMLSLRGVPADQRAAILDLGGGHPLALSLAAEAMLTSDATADGFKTRRTVVDALLTRVVGVLPSPGHRLALQACAQSYAATEELLAAVLPAAVLTAEQPPGVFDWLRGLPYIDSTGQTLRVHDVIREALEFDLRWRDPVGYTSMERRIASYLTGALGRKVRRPVTGDRAC